MSMQEINIWLKSIAPTWVWAIIAILIGALIAWITTPNPCKKCNMNNDNTDEIEDNKFQ